MSQSPYDTTMYIDADCEIVHEDIATVFDELNGNDMVFHTLPKKQTNFVTYDLLEVNQNSLLIVGVSVFTNKEFMTDWYMLYLKQLSKIWTPDMNQDKLYYLTKQLCGGC